MAKRDQDQKGPWPKRTNRVTKICVTRELIVLSLTDFKYVRQAFYFLTLPWVIRGKTDLG